MPSLLRLAAGLPRCCSVSSTKIQKSVSNRVMSIDDRGVDALRASRHRREQQQVNARKVRMPRAACLTLQPLACAKRAAAPARCGARDRRFVVAGFECCPFMQNDACSLTSVSSALGTYSCPHDFIFAGEGYTPASNQHARSLAYNDFFLRPLASVGTCKLARAKIRKTRRQKSCA